MGISASIFFDPWIDLDYYYTNLPLLPLIYDHVYIYYPSDRWVETTNSLSPAERVQYRSELGYWFDRRVLIPVVKGEYPFVGEIGKGRLEADGPTDKFKESLSQFRTLSESKWIVLDPYSTERGRSEAEKLILNYSDDELLRQAIQVEISPTGVPQLAYYYAGGKQAKIKQTLVETIGTYENDDWIRREKGLGEYLLPSFFAYQYRALKDLQNQNDRADILHNTATALAVDTFIGQNAGRLPNKWPNRKKIELWRELGLHKILRNFLLNEAKAVKLLGKDEEEKGIIIGHHLAKLRDKLPIGLRSILIEQNLMSDIIVSLFVTSGFVASELDALTGFAVGHVGQKAIRLGIKKIHWGKFLDLVGDTLGTEAEQKLQSHILGFGDVSVFG